MAIRVKNTAHFLSGGGPAYITGLAGGGTGYFRDQHGQPRLLLSDTVWDLINNAGQNNTSWQADLDAYCNARGGQGFTASYVSVFSSPANGVGYTAGGTWDGVHPFVSDDPSQGLNSAFWTRVDYFISACARNGMAAWLDLCYGDQVSADPSLGAFTTPQLQAFGSALAARYKDTPNIIWQYGGDYYPGNSGDDTVLETILTAIRGGGDSHVISVENSSESTSRHSLLSGNAVQPLGNAIAQFNSVYTYIQTYFGIRYALGESSPIPAVWCDGYYYKNSGSSYYGSYDRAERQYAWWALTSGARGVNCGSEDIWQWDASSLAQVTNEYFYLHTAAAIRAAVESLPGWNLLQPDSGTLVTSGAGTPVASDSGVHYGEATTDSYVTASRAPDGSLALIYLSHATTIGINQAQMAAGYTATWIDPDTGAAYAGTPGASYNSGAADGTKPVSNSRGDPDWVLALKAP